MCGTKRLHDTAPIGEGDATASAHRTQAKELAAAGAEQVANGGYLFPPAWYLRAGVRARRLRRLPFESTVVMECNGSQRKSVARRSAPANHTADAQHALTS